MVQYRDAINLDSGEIVSIEQVADMSPRPKTGSFRCPICDAVLTPAAGDIYEWHFKHKEVLDSQCPQQHRIHWLAKNALNRVFKERLANKIPLNIKVQKTFECSCPIHSEPAFNVPKQWVEDVLVDLSSIYTETRMESDPERRWAPKLWLVGAKRDIRVEVDAGKSIAEHCNEPTIECLCPSDRSVDLIEKGLLDQLQVNRHHWPTKVEKGECCGMDLEVWWGVKYTSGKIYVPPHPAPYSEYHDFRMTKGRSRSVAELHCIRQSDAYNSRDAKRVMFPVQAGSNHPNGMSDDEIIIPFS